MTTSFIAAEVTFEISWSVAFKWYIIHTVGRESVFTDLEKTAVRLRG